jgi:FkbM family methyltransferase
MFSNTFYEHALGWRGIMVEANPTDAAKLREANKPRTARFSVGICEIDARHPGNLTFSTTGGSVATAVDYAAPGFLDRWKGSLGEDRIVVQCVPLQLIIDATGLLDIAFFGLDVEGAEELVLATVDLGKTNIRLIQV